MYPYPRRNLRKIVLNEGDKVIYDENILFRAIINEMVAFKIQPS